MVGQKTIQTHAISTQLLKPEKNVKPTQTSDDLRITDQNFYQIKTGFDQVISELKSH